MTAHVRDSSPVSLFRCFLLHFSFLAVFLAALSAPSISAADQTIFSSDFSSNASNWNVMSGRWWVHRSQSYVSAKRQFNLSQANGVYLPAGNTFTISANVKLVKARRGAPKAGFAFGLRNSTNYYYLLITPRRMILKQMGSPDGQVVGLPARARVRFGKRRWRNVQLLLDNTGQLAVFVDDLSTPVGTYPMPGVNGGVALLAKNTKAFFDDVVITRKGGQGISTPTPTGSSTPTPTGSATATPTGSATATPTPTASPPPVALAAPTEVQALAISHNTVALSWKDNSNNEQEFRIQRSTSCSGGFTAAGTAAANAVNHQVSSLAASQFYCFNVCAYRAGQTACSAKVSTTTLQNPSAIGAPTNLQATVQSYKKVRLNWQSNSSNHDGFEIEQSPTNNSGRCTGFIAVGRVASLAVYTVDGLAAATKYCFRVRAYNGSGYSNYSNTVKPTTQAAPTQGPQGSPVLTGTVLSSSSVVLNWTDVQYENFYEVWWKNLPHWDWERLVNVEADGTSITIIDLQPNTSYSFGVFAVNDHGFTNSNGIVLPTHSSGNGTLQVVNYSGYRILYIQVNGVEQLGANQMIEPGGNYWHKNFAPGQYTVQAGAGLCKTQGNLDCGSFFNSQATHTIQADKTSQHFVTIGDLLQGEWYGVQWNTEPWTEHKLVFTAHPLTGAASYARSKKTSGGWTNADQGAVSNVTWYNLSPIATFTLGQNGPQSSVAWPFSDLTSYVAVGGGGQMFARQ